jgi:hypothetical protein
MTPPRVRVLALLATAALAASTLAGCGGSGGATTTTASDPDGVVTIQTDTVLHATTGATGSTTPPRTTPPADATATSTTSEDPGLDADVAALSATIDATLTALRRTTALPDAPALAQTITKRTEAFDRAVDTIAGQVVTGQRATAIRAAVVAAAPAASEAYRTFVDAAQQAADSNNSAALAGAERRLATALGAFTAALARP